MRRVLICVFAASLAVCHAREEKSGAFVASDLSGWEGLTKEHWAVKDGAVVGHSRPKGISFNTFLVSEKKYKDFDLKFKVKLDKGNGNSGIQFRSKLINKDKYTVHGPQADIGAGFWGSLYGEGFGGMMKASSKESQKAVKPSEYNDYHLRVVGKKVTIAINGTTTVDEEFAKLPDEGIIAFQLHGGGPMEVTFKDIQFTELSK